MWLVGGANTRLVGGLLAVMGRAAIVLAQQWVLCAGMVMEDILSSLKIVLSLHFLRQLGISAPHSQHRVHLGLQQPPVQHQALTFDWRDGQARHHLCVGGWRFDPVLNGAQFVMMALEVKMPRWCAGSFR